MHYCQWMPIHRKCWCPLYKWQHAALTHCQCKNSLLSFIRNTTPLTLVYHIKNVTVPTDTGVCFFKFSSRKWMYFFWEMENLIVKVNYWSSLYIFYASPSMPKKLSLLIFIMSFYCTCSLSFFLTVTTSLKYHLSINQGYLSFSYGSLWKRINDLY